MTTPRHQYNPRQNRSRRLAAIMIASLVAPSALGATRSAGQEAHAHPAGTTAADGASMMEKCKAMMSEHQEAMRKQQAMDSKLDELVAAMKSATGDDKVPAIEAVVVELVSQRRAMHGMMADHHAGMMRHMMEHMSQGMPMGEGRSMMEMCPMMQGTAAGGEGEQSEEGDGGHSEHHPP